MFCWGNQVGLGRSGQDGRFWLGEVGDWVLGFGVGEGFVRAREYGIACGCGCVGVVWVRVWCCGIRVSVLLVVCCAPLLVALSFKPSLELACTSKVWQRPGRPGPWSTNTLDWARIFLATNDLSNSTLSPKSNRLALQIK